LEKVSSKCKVFLIFPEKMISEIHFYPGKNLTQKIDQSKIIFKNLGI